MHIFVKLLKQTSNASDLLKISLAAQCELNDMSPIQ